MYRQFNIQQFYVLPTHCIYVFCVDLRTNRVYFPMYSKLTSFYNRDGDCLLHGTDWVFKYNLCIAPEKLLTHISKLCPFYSSSSQHLHSHKTEKSFCFTAVSPGFTHV